MIQFKQLLFALVLLCLGSTAFAQVKVGDNPTTIDASSLLELESTNKGFLLPRMTQAQRDAIASPAQGLVIYNTTASCIQINTGTPATPDWKCISVGLNATTNGTGIVSAYGGAGCTGSGTINGTLTQGVAVSGVTMTLYANVITLGTYNLSSTQNGVTFSGSGTFTALGCQLLTLTASGTPTTAGATTWSTNSIPVGSATATVQSGASTDADGDGVPDAIDNCPSTPAGIAVNATGCTVSNCGAFVAPKVYKTFLCHNLGANTALDPHDLSQTNAWDLNGAYIQFGRRGPNTTGDSRVDWRTAPNDGPNGFSARSTSASDNTAAIAGWSTSSATLRRPDWQYGNGKTANDPCPAGWRLPSSEEWAGVFNHNNITPKGTWPMFGTDFNSGVNIGPNATTTTLTLPNAGFRNSVTGGALSRELVSGYWSRTGTFDNFANTLYFKISSDEITPNATISGNNGYPIRCISQ